MSLHHPLVRPAAALVLAAVTVLGSPPIALAEAPDCNGNGIPDDIDIAGGTSPDGNLNGVPDECECGCIDLTLLIDVTGSMDGAIGNLKSEIDAVIAGIETYAQGDLRLSLITFRENVSVLHALTTDLEAVRSSVLGLSAGGGGGPQSASDEALREMITNDSECLATPTGFDVPFRGECRKRSILITDVPPGGCDDVYVPGVDDLIAGQRAAQAAAQQIQISAILVPTGPVGVTESIMQGYAITTGGRFAIVGPDGSGTANAVLSAIETCDTLPCSLLVNGCLAEEVFKVTPADGQENDLAGRSVSIDRDVAIVGAELHDEAGTNAGAAYVYHRNGAGWVQHTKLQPNDLAAGDFFGNAVAMSGAIAVVGAFGDDDGGTGSGSAYVFARNAGGLDQWGQLAKLTASDAAPNDQFGRSVAVHGGVIVVGAIANDDDGTNSGAAYVFVRHAGGPHEWGQVAKLTASDAAASDRFGTGAAVNANTIVIGAPGRDGPHSNAGAAYVFHRDAGGPDAWGETAVLRHSDPTPEAQFGVNVSIFGDAAVIGSVTSFNCGGIAYVFRHADGAWSEETKLATSAVVQHDVFGTSVAISNDLAVVGAHDGETGFISTGSVFLYQYTGAEWIVQANLTASDAAIGDLIGDSVDIHYGRSIAGAVGDDERGSQSGSAYFFGGLDDCDGNGRADVCDISAGLAVDADGDGIPDDCAPVCDLRQIRVAQESSPGAGDFVDHPVGCLWVYPTISSAAGVYADRDNAYTGVSILPKGDRSHLFFADTTDGRSLVIVHDRTVPPNPDGGRAEMRFELTGDPDGLTRTVEDDPEGLFTDEYTGEPGDSLFTAAQAWSGSGADGLVLSGLDETWTLDVQFTNVDGSAATPAIDGLDTWVAYSGNGEELTLALAAGRRVRFSMIDESVGPTCPADVTGPADAPDGNVDAIDFLLLIGQWGTPCVGSCESDVTGPVPLAPDGNVDALDLLLLISQWGTPASCP